MDTVARQCDATTAEGFLQQPLPEGLRRSWEFACDASSLHRGHAFPAGQQHVGSLRWALG